MTALVWFRRDLRLTDNPAWATATANHDHVQALFVLEPALWAASGLRNRQLAANLRALDGALAARGGRLFVAPGPAANVLPHLASDHEAVYWNADYSPFAIARDRSVAGRLPVPASVHHGSLVHPPGAVTTRSGDAFRVFTPFWRRWRSHPGIPWPAEGPARVIDRTGIGVPGDELEPPYEAGESGAARRLDVFLEAVERYGEDRDRPDIDATSRLSVDLKFGTISPRLLAAEVGDATAGREAFLRQLAWRDFHAHALTAFPQGYIETLNSRYRNLRWRDDPVGFEAWRSGRTGYPLVDAGMRQLLAEGWMHNRVRLVTASFLVKDLLIDWRLGERHFRRLLIDADPAQNVGNWQWVAGTGFDAAPYFRIMNPVAQSRRHDPDGIYIRRWVPEISSLPAPAVHAPWEHPKALAEAGVALGSDYPLPIVDHREARSRALDAYAAARGHA